MTVKILGNSILTGFKESSIRGKETIFLNSQVLTGAL